MKILAIERELKENSDFSPYLKQEALAVWKNYLSGFIREIYFSQENHGAIIILECKDKKEAEKKLNQFPLVKNKLIIFDIIPLIPYNGWERLFTE